jgi:branched-chain amino acid transport system ATP-binding protein
MLTIDGIDVVRGHVKVLWDVSLTVDEGEIVALIGSNGAGKSTTINAVSGVAKVEKGNIKYRGKEIQNAPPHRIVEMGICQIPEERLLFPRMSVLENLELGSFAKRARDTRSQLIERAFELFPILSTRKGQMAGSLSGGEQQMLAIARGLTSRPELLILDEPSFGLAPILVDQIFEAIKRISDDGVTVLLSEQNVFESLELCHRGYVLENGKIKLSGKGPELLLNAYVKEAYLGL